MKVFIGPRTGMTRAMARVTEALTKYAPSYIKIVESDQHADLVILHTVSHQQAQATVERLQARQQGYAMIQYLVRTTERPLTKGWVPMWQRAVVVWSYLDLFALALEDHPNGMFDPEKTPINFYYAPFGVDPLVFKPLGNPEKRYTIVTNGSIGYTETVAEAALATERVGGLQCHIGPELYLGSYVRCMTGINDERLAYEYTRSHFVAGLRRKEGFEIPVIEGLMCGARPVVYERPHYRHWYNDIAVFINEGSFDEVADALEHLFRGDYNAVSEQERQLVSERFNWETIVSEFWKRI